MNNILEFYVKMKDMMSGGLAKLSQNSRAEFGKVQDNIDKTVKKNKELADSFEGVSKKAKASFGGIKDIMAGTLGADAIKGVLSSGFDFVKGSVSKAMEFGKTKESFKVLTGDAGKGEALANDLNKLQQNTILGPEVFKAAQTMLGFGIASDKVIPTMKMLGDISMGDAGKMESLTLAFSQISSAGKLSGQDLLQMINAGFNPLNEISKKTGISIGDLKKQMEKGAISAKMVEDALVGATSKGGAFDGMMNKLAQTPAGKLAQLEGAWEGFTIKVGEAMMPIATALMDMVTPLMDMAQNILPVVSAWISGIVDYFTGAREMTGNWSVYLQTAQEYIGILWDGLSHVFGVVWHILQGLFEWVGHSEILKDVFIFIKDVAAVTWSFLKQAADVIGWIWDNVLKPLLDGLDAAWKLLKNLLGMSGSEVKVNVSKAATAQPSSSSSLTATQAVGKSGAGQMAAPSIKDKGDVAKGIAGGGPRVVNITIGKMVDKIEMHVGGVQEGLNNLESKIEEVFLRVLNSGAAIQ